MSEKVGGVLFALVFAVCFGGVGVFASSVMGTALWEGFVAQDWIKVRAEVVRYDSAGVSYRYRVNDRDYTGEKLGVGWLQNSEVDDELDARLTAAVSEKKPVTIFVDPDQPSRSMVDPQIPWTMMAFMTPFALGFGGVGLGALYMIFHILSGGDRRKAAKKVKSSAGSEALGIWVFAFFWNVISFPIALIAVPDMWRSGEWLGLLILIFPAIGVLMIWSAISSTIRMIRRGPAELLLSTKEPRMGLPLSGQVAFSRGVRAGDQFRAKLSAHIKEENSSTPRVVWAKDSSVQAVEVTGSSRVNFSFQVPSRLPTNTVDPEEYGDLIWRLELYLPRQTRDAAYSFGLELAPAPDVEDAGSVESVGHAAGFVSNLDGKPLPAGLPAEFQGLAALVGQEKLDSMSARDRAKLHEVAGQLSPEHREQVAKLIKAGPLIKKLVIAAIVLFVAVQIVGAIVALGFSQ